MKSCTARRAYWTSLLVTCALLVLSCCAQALQVSRMQDASGTLMTVPASVSRIVSLAPNLTEILCGIGLGEKLVGVSSYSNYPPAVKKLPKVGGFASLNIEMIVSLRPDMAVATMDGNSKADVTKLRSLGIPVFCVFPNNVKGLMRSIEQLGRLFRRERQAKELVSNIDLVVKQVKLKAASFTRSRGRPRVLIALDIKPVVSASAQTFLGELIEIAGGVNVVGASDIRYPRLGLETIVASAPDVILVTGHGSRKGLLKELRSWARWREIPAIRNGRVYLLDPDITTRPGPRVAGALMTIQRNLFAK